MCVCVCVCETAHAAHTHTHTHTVTQCVVVCLWMKRPVWMSVEFAAAVDMAQRVCGGARREGSQMVNIT